jgi:ubiquinone/menaquinone biosynthesis C-methylase UbiE
MPNNAAHTTNWQVTIMNVLQMHPGVREAAVVRDGCDGMAAFVVPNDSYMDDVLGRALAGINTVGKWRKASNLSQLTKEAASAPVGFNTLGWDSSYTRQPIPADQMREWVETTVAGIFRFAPKTVYEIGCGTGMLLMRIAPRCDRYVALDFSPVVLDRLREQLRTVPSFTKQVEIVERTADNFEGIEENSFDTVVLNSIVQYFPSTIYLTKVLERAIHVVRPGGRIFVGDIRSLPLLSAFASSVELFQVADEVTTEDLRNRIRRRMEREQEQVISPAYFLSLQSRFPQLSRVEIEPRRGRADNEMTCYRYNAILHVGHETQGLRSDRFRDWGEHKWTLEEIRSMLRQHPNESFGIKRIVNARIEKDLAGLAMLRNADAGDTASELRHELEQYPQEGIHPQAIIDLETQGLGFAVFISWAACRPDGRFDAYFIPTELLKGVTMPAIDWPKAGASAVVLLTNAPGQGKLRDELIGQLVAHCSQNLSGDMLPREIRLVDAVPGTPDGNADASALLAGMRCNSI